MIWGPAIGRQNQIGIHEPEAKPTSSARRALHPASVSAIAAGHVGTRQRKALSATCIERKKQEGRHHLVLIRGFS